MKSTIISIAIAILLVGGTLVLVKGSSSVPVGRGNNVTVENGKQIITITAKGGYLPKRSIAKANMPTVLRFVTNGTFDCSAFVRIPKLNITQYLKQTGREDIDVGTQSAGTLQGTCAMGMYPFEIEFKS